MCIVQFPSSLVYIIFLSSSGSCSRRDLIWALNICVGAVLAIAGSGGVKTRRAILTSNGFGLARCRLTNRSDSVSTTGSSSVRLRENHAPVYLTTEAESQTAPLLSRVVHGSDIVASAGDMKRGEGRRKRWCAQKRTGSRMDSD